MDEAGRGKRRPDHAFFRNDHLFLDVHHAALAVVRSVGERARAHALEPDRADRSQVARPSTAPGSGFSPCRAWRGFCPCRACPGANACRLHSCGLQQVPGRHAGSACRITRQIVPECPLSTVSHRYYVAPQAGCSLAGACRRRIKTSSPAGACRRAKTSRMTGKERMSYARREHQSGRRSCGGCAG